MPIEFLKFNPVAPKNHLVIVRAGQDSVHPQYFYGASQPIHWDRMVISYVEPNAQDLQQAEYVVRGGLTKWTDFHELIQMNFFADRGYQYILLADDDVLPSQTESVNVLFDLARQFNFQVCQPALTHDSFFSWWVTLQAPSFHVRYTNFVECMAPVFSRDSLRLMHAELSRAISGCGLDLIFSELFDMTRHPLGIIDDVAFRHTKPIDPQGGRFYQHLRAHGVDPQREIHDYMRRFNLTEKHVQTLGGVTKIQRMDLPKIA